MSAPGGGGGASERDLMASWLRANEVPVPPGLNAGGLAGALSGNAGSGPPPSVTRFNQLVKEWEDIKASTSLASFDPTEILKQVANLLEKVNKSQPFIGTLFFFALRTSAILILGKRRLSFQRS